MPNQRKVKTNEELQLGSKYLRYHIKMYVQTLLFLIKHKNRQVWDTKWNAFVETHLVHARVLNNFVNPSHSRPDDILAIDYFHDNPNIFHPQEDDSIKKQSDKIGGQLVHLTTKAMPDLKSQQEWKINEIAGYLNPELRNFLNNVNTDRLADNVKDDCLKYLQKIPNGVNICPVYAST